MTVRFNGLCVCLRLYLTEGQRASRRGGKGGGERGAAERDASMIGRKVDNIQGSSSR